MAHALPECQPTLETARLRFEPYGLDDDAWLADLAGPLEVARWTGLPHPLDRAGARAWLGERQALYRRGTAVAWAVRERDTGRPLGGASLRLGAEFGVADVGFWVGQDHWGRGHATEMARTLIDFAFDVWDARRLEAHCVADNLGSKVVLERVGFTLEGRLREGFRRFGGIHDLLLFGMLRRERPEPADR